MKYVVFILFLLIAANSSKADDVKVVNAGKVEDIQVMGSSKRNHVVQEPQFDVDEVIRAEDDPHFLEYLKERERQSREERAAALAYEKQRLADEEARAKVRHQYFKEKREQAAREASKKQIIAHVDDEKAWQQQQEKYRKEYLAQHEKEMEKLNSERMARIQRAKALQRIPASEN